MNSYVNPRNAILFGNTANVSMSVTLLSLPQYSN